MDTSRGIPRARLAGAQECLSYVVRLYRRRYYSDPGVLYRPSDIVADIEPARLLVVRAETAVRSLTDTEGRPAQALDALVLARRALG